MLGQIRILVEARCSRLTTPQKKEYANILQPKLDKNIVQEVALEKSRQIFDMNCNGPCFCSTFEWEHKQPNSQTPKKKKKKKKKEKKSHRLANNSSSNLLYHHFRFTNLRLSWLDVSWAAWDIGSDCTGGSRRGFCR
jgi:hypothetical protein